MWKLFNTTIFLGISLLVTIVFFVVLLMINFFLSINTNTDNHICVYLYCTNLKTVSVEEIEDVFQVVDEKTNYIFFDLYPTSVQLPIVSEETIIINDYLEEQDFEKIDWNWGNGISSPRIFSLTYQKGELVCELQKIYHPLLYFQQGNDVNQMYITEEIFCS